MDFQIGMTYEILATVLTTRDSGNMRVQIGGQEVLLSADALGRALIPSILPDAPSLVPPLPTEPSVSPVSPSAEPDPVTPPAEQYVVTMDSPPTEPPVREGEAQNP